MAKKEAKQDKPAAETAPQPKVDFEAWWAVVQKKLPQHHHKEIVKADFKARGLSASESMSTFEGALEKYGVKLK